MHKTVTEQQEDLKDAVREDLKPKGKRQQLHTDAVGWMAKLSNKDKARSNVR